VNPDSVKLSHRNLPLLLLQAREQVIARFRPILNEHGITEQQWRIVRALIDTGPLEPREIGELCRISSPSLAGVLSRMEELGYIRRKRLEHDQRRLRVSLTPRSRALSARMAPQIEATYRGIEALIGERPCPRRTARLPRPASDARLSCRATLVHHRQNRLNRHSLLNRFTKPLS
jgi:homoprotocatechuate degradation regulator HpaR